jgi:hypothetical protein
LIGGISVVGVIGAIWGVLGVTLLLGRGLFALAPYALGLYEVDLEWFHWVLLTVSIFFMGYTEGYRGFQLKFSPRTAARALYLKRNPSLVRVLLAPFFCMGFFYATRKRKALSWSLSIAIIGLVVLVGKLEQPWRGIVDVGVLVGLTWGIASLVVFAGKAFFGNGFDVSPETPDS